MSINMKGKTKFNTEVFLIVIIAIASILASWGRSLLPIINITNDTTITVMQIVCLFILFITSISVVYYHRYNEKEVIRAVLQSVHKIFYRETTDIKFESGRNPTCRCTYFKHYKFTKIESYLYLYFTSIPFFLLTISIIPQNWSIFFCYCLFSLLLLQIFWFTPKLRQLCNGWIFRFLFMFCIFIIISILFLIYFDNVYKYPFFIPLLIFCVLLVFTISYITDSWFYHYITRLIKNDGIGRNMKWNKDYLLSYVRFGYEGGKTKNRNTTLALEVGDKTGRLFGGMLYNSNNWYMTSVNHQKINDLIKKIETKKNLSAPQNNFLKSQEKKIKALINKGIDENINFLNSNFFLDEEKADVEKIKKFMKETNTPCWDLFNINKINHCEHFIGFKVDSKDKTEQRSLGIILIDLILQNADDTFEQALEQYKEYILRHTPSKNNNDFLLPIYLSAYSETLTNILN